MALMVVVNTPGDGATSYMALRHVPWHGWTITDLVFPSFVWIVGVALTLALSSKLDQGASGTEIAKSATRRAAVLFAIGVLLYAVPSFDPTSFRILGVLQRIAICYFAASLLFLVTGWRGQAIAIAALLFGYWALMAGDLTLEGNLAHSIDRAWLGTHNYHNTKTWDPEGILSTLPAIATCLLGVLCGHILKRDEPLANRCSWLSLAGSALLVTGLVWDIVFPINKMIWTSSYVCFAAGIDFLLFAAVLWLVDGNAIRKPFTPFVVLGSNAIAIYLSSEGLDMLLGLTHSKEAIYQAVFAPLASPAISSLLFSLAFLGVNFLFALLLWRKRWFLRV